MSNNTNSLAFCQENLLSKDEIYFNPDKLNLWVFFGPKGVVDDRGNG